jgi:DDE superfamily endonuclease
VREQRSGLRGKKNKIVSLYRNPPKDGVVICVDEMGPLACIPRGGRGWGKKPARRPDRYHRSNTIQLLAAFAPHAGHAVGIPSANKTGEVVLAFLQDTVLPSFGADRKVYLVWDNFSAHKRALGLWKSAPKNIEFYWTPTNASWLNLIEPWFLVLEKTALYNTDLKTTDAIAENLKQGIEYLNSHPRPYRWTKTL